MRKMHKTGNIEAIYPLSPMQAGILFHTLYTPHSAGYFEQFSYTLEGDLNVPAFERAWQTIVARHPILRTLFTWEKRNQPLQIVRQKVTVPFIYHDWQAWSHPEQQARLEAFLSADREQGFTLSKAPLMRLALQRLDERRYQFTWSFHHLLLDGWSGPIILAEFFTLYEGFCRAENPVLPHRRPYRDYISWLQQQDLTAAERFWRAYLDGFTTPTPFGVDTPKPKGQTEAYAKQELVLPAALSKALQQLVQQYHLTMSTLIQGVWAIILSRYSNERDVIFGTTVSGRAASLPDIENMVGLFINTLPLRVQVTPEASFLKWLQALQGQQVERQLYEHSSLVDIQQWSDLPANAPMFESILALGNYPAPDRPESSQYALTISDIRIFEQTNYPLTIYVRPGTQLSWQFQYDCHRFDDSTIRRMLGHIQTLLKAIVVDPGQLLSELSWLTAIERKQLLTAWNQTEQEYAREFTIHQCFEAQVEQTPDHVAVVFENHQLTYRQLDERANQVAHLLRKLGLGPDELVGICLDRSIDMVVGLLGALKAGGAYVPLDPMLPKERLTYMLADSQPRVLLTQAKIRDQLPDYQGEVIYMDTDQSRIEQEATGSLPNQTDPAHLAYVIYTSGSTGKPKGVQIPHRAVINFLTAMQNRPGLTEQDRLLAVTTLSFDIAVLEIFLPLITGAQLIIISREVAADGVQLRNRLERFAPTIMQATPTTWRLLLAAGWEGDQQLKVLCGGEAFPRDLAKTLCERCAAVWNMYGPTETTIWSTIHPAEIGEGVLAIGRPIANTQTYILDSSLDPVPVGVAGELYIGGAGLARGYFKHPYLTAEKFAPNPFSDQPGARLYRTGDLARYLPDGNIEFIGRIDHQVKIRGHRIELGDVEANLTRHPAIREGVVVAHKDDSETRLVAYLVADQQPQPAIDDLRTYLKQRLPDYMLPATFLFLETLPLTPNGKIDRRALPEPDRSRPVLAKRYVAPETEIEQMIAAIWQEILNLDKVGRHDNFFDLGGHSLLAIQVISRLQAAFDITLPLDFFFDAPTIAKLAQTVEEIVIAELEELSEEEAQRLAESLS